MQTSTFPRSPSASPRQTPRWAIYLALSEGQKLIIQVPKGKCPFGLSKQQYDEDAPPKYDLNVSLGGSDKMNDFRQFVSDLDAHIQKSAVENSEKWFGKKKSAGVIEELYKPMLVEPKKGDYAPTMKFKFPYYDDKFTTTVFDSNKEEVSPEIITKGFPDESYCSAHKHVVCGKAIWCDLANSFKQSVYPGSALPKYAFADDDDDEVVEDDEYDEEEEQSE